MKTKKTFTREEHESVAKSLIGKTIELYHKDHAFHETFTVVKADYFPRYNKTRVGDAEGHSYNIWWSTTDKWQQVLKGETAKDQGWRINLVNN